MPSFKLRSEERPIPRTVYWIKGKRDKKGGGEFGFWYTEIKPDEMEGWEPTDHFGSVGYRCNKLEFIPVVKRQDAFRYDKEKMVFTGKEWVQGDLLYTRIAGFVTGMHEAMILTAKGMNGAALGAAMRKHFELIRLASQGEEYPYTMYCAVMHLAGEGWTSGKPVFRSPKVGDAKNIFTYLPEGEGKLPDWNDVYIGEENARLISEDYDAIKAMLYPPVQPVEPEFTPDLDEEVPF